MICHKKNFFFRDEFEIKLTSNHIHLIHGPTKYKIPLQQTQCVDWKISKNEKYLKAFGIMLNGEWQYFTMDQNSIKVLKGFLDGKVQYRQIFKMYEIVSFLGKGAFGMVFKYINRLTGQLFACKSIRKSTRNTEADFLFEVKCMQELRHPNICSFKEFYIEQKHFYIIMEYIQGDTLKNLMANQHLDSYQQMLIVQQLLKLAHYFHSEGYIYRDFKLENILFQENDINQLKLIDFGLTMKKSIQKHQICGTPGYMPPEIFNKDYQYDYKADMFSLGVVIFELYTNTYLIAHQDAEKVYELNKCYKFDQSILSSIQNEKIYKLLSSLLRNEPEERMSAKEALEFLDANTKQSQSFIIECLTTNTD